MSLPQPHPWLAAPLSGSALTMTVTFLHTLHHYHYPARVGESWQAWIEANFLTQILLHTLLAEWAAILQFVSDMKYWLKSTLWWIDFYDCKYFYTVPGDIDKAQQYLSN